MTDVSKQPSTKRKLPWDKAYSMLTQQEVVKRIGVRFLRLGSTAISVEDMLERVGYYAKEMQKYDVIVTKDEVYKQIIRYHMIEGSIIESHKEANTNDLVFSIIGPILEDFMNRTGRDTLRLMREKKIISVDAKTGGFKEFVVADVISDFEESYILIIEAKATVLDAAMNQCLLALKDLDDRNNGYIIYGFVTTGDIWQMVSYDGASFVSTDKFQVVFDTMCNNKKRWLTSYSILVDCIYAALSTTGAPRKEKESVMV